ncbi:vesicle-associated protein 1-3-like [Amaranthus tricolor]|uniref:vesicle-associated protein 1-3-like n=1 Tax=Amaranthus tricolor TaxID=29722 RepID=UPI002589F2A6|nr:vesicle-associated protein 1-3-like [Amaranthus tricolor]
MCTGDLVQIEPAELKFPFELRRQSSCSMHLINKTDQYVAFKVKTTNPKKYCVRPNTGVVLPGAACDVTVTMQAQKETPPDMQCKDKFLVQSVVVPDSSTTKDITSEMFNKEEGKLVEEFKLRVVYIPANPPSPVPEESEEGSPPREDSNEHASLASAVTRSLEGSSKEKDHESRALISKLTNEKASAIQQSQKLRQELEILKREIGRRRTGGLPLYAVALIGIICILMGYFIKRT